MVRRRGTPRNPQKEAAFTSSAQCDTQLSIRSTLGVGPNIALAWPTYLLSQSIRDLGVLHPVLYWRGERLDGQRREELSRAMGRPCPRADIPSERHAARLLWRLHPERAWALFVRRGMRRLHIADLMGIALEDLPDRRLIHQWLRAPK